MSLPMCRRQPGPKRGYHQSSDQLARPATGKRPKPTIASWVSGMPIDCSGDSANSSFFVLFGGVRCTLFISACSSGGNGPASVGAAPPSPVWGDAGGASPLPPPFDGGVSSLPGATVVVVVEDPGDRSSGLVGSVVDVVDEAGASVVVVVDRAVVLGE